MSLLKNLCSLFIERNFNSPLFSNPYRLSTTCTMYSLLSSLWRFCRYPVWNRSWICLYHFERKWTRALYRLTFQSVLGDFAAIICQENFHYSRGSSQSSFVIRKYTIFLRTDVYWFFFLRNNFMLRFTNVCKVKWPSRESSWVLLIISIYLR